MTSSIIRLPALIVLFIAVGSNAVCSEFNNERQLYLQGMEVLKKARFNDYRLILSKLKSYPLYPYLLEAGLRKQIENVDKHTQSTDFLEKYKGMPVVTRLRRKWLSYLERNEKWEDISRLHIPSGFSSQRCIYQKSLYHLGMQESAFESIEKLWVTRVKIPNACRFLVEKWSTSGAMSNDLVWERIFLLLRHSRIVEAKKLDENLSADERVISYLLFTIHEQPELLADLNKFITDNEHYDKIVVHGIHRLATRDLELALELWSEVRLEHDINEKLYKDTEIYLARKMAYKHHTSAFERFTEIDEQSLAIKDKQLMLRISISSQNWYEILEAISTFSQSQQMSDRLQYWSARAYEKINRLNEALVIYKALSRKQGYYGFLSADRLSLEYTIGNPTEYSINLDSVNVIEDTPDVMRARELFMVGQIADARREWRHSSRYYNNEQLLQAAHLSQRWGWYDRAIFALARTPFKDALELRFPLVHKEHISASALRNEIEPAWVFALIRQESAFISDALSSSGALGLMQLMPKTARQVGRKLKIRRLRSTDILDVKTNIRLGTNYLSGRYKYFDQHKVLATAAYNAGPHRVKQWLPDEGSIPADVWIDSIPFKETRNYVKNILAYLVIYEKRLGLEPKKMSLRMPDIIALDALYDKKAANI